MTCLKLSRRTYAFLTTLTTSSTHRLRSPASILGVNGFLQPLSRRNAIAIAAPSGYHQHPHCLFSTSSSSSSFQAPEPPTSKGHPIFPDVDLPSSSTTTTSSPPTISEDARQRNSDPDAVFVVNGASRGIGLQLVQSLLDRTKGTVVAGCRTPNNPRAPLHAVLESLDATTRARVDPVWLDLEDQSSIDALAVYLSSHHRGRVDGLFNVAGILGNGETTPGPERSLARIERDWLEHTLAVNVVGHVMLVKALRPMLKTTNNKGGSSGTTTKQQRPTSVVVNLSARVGSISDNELGGWYSYRISKAAFNQATRTMAHELVRQGTYALAVHPGTTDTDLSLPFQRNVKPEQLFPVDFTVTQILDVVDHLREEHSGGLYDWAGKAIPF